MELGDLVTNILLPLGGGLGGWFVGRRKRDAEAESEELKNVQSTLGIYTQMINDLKTHMDSLEKRVTDLMAENMTLKAKLIASKQSNDAMKKRIEALEAQIKTQ